MNAKRAPVPIESSLAVAVPHETPHLIGEGGVEYVQVIVANSPAFAQVCLAVWSERDGRNRSWMLKQKTFFVPVDVVPAARAYLEARKKREAGR